MASPKEKPARRGATSQRKASKSSGGGFKIPGWLWGIAGLAAGFFLAQHQHGTAPWQEQEDTPQATVLPKPADSDERSAARQTETVAEPSMPTFEFYTLLPDTEVIAPGVSLPSTVNRPEAAQQEQTTASNETTTSNASARQNDDPIAQVIAANMRPEEQVAAAQQAPASNTPNRYMLQAASFRELSDAEQLRGRLRNLSLLAQVSEVKANGDTWHRVQVGPYEDTRELNRAQDLMATQGIEPLLIQLQN
ncbi:MAG: SPOR domain-containing protein [Vreelandella alkaliphila]|uniref:SPOR domain-containing protein n=1 Tax=Halomonas campaniensis TaxID=213554 RepID=A0A3D0KFB7_9GAMM|nr:MULTISPECIES: SPOR domain-containing protein [unclassified Halomonas]HBP42570.1 SPOR domain-containing protein [Halomonas sp.]HBS83591.1 SPOR domain-containing protein [Halomonas campaniensis]HCA01990.1 SPOR domain-containing protein [Halomonas campaniensis]